MTDALWWLVCMRLALEPKSRNGGTVAAKPGYHSWGSRLPSTDHSIRYSWDRTGPWWQTKSSAHDWTFTDAQSGNYATIIKYTKRLVVAMRDPKDLRPDNVYAYTLGQLDNDRVVEGYNERTDDDETSGDLTHLWHRHDSFRRNIVGDFWAMWKALTIDMGWTFAEWAKSVETTPRKVEKVKVEANLPALKKGDNDTTVPGDTNYVRRAQALLVLLGGYTGKLDGDYGKLMAEATKVMMKNDNTRSSADGTKFGLPEWRRAIGAW